METAAPSAAQAAADTAAAAGDRAGTAAAAVDTAAAAAQPSGDDEEFVVSDATRRARRNKRLESAKMNSADWLESGARDAWLRHTEEQSNVRDAVHAEYAKLRASAHSSADAEAAMVADVAEVQPEVAPAQPAAAAGRARPATVESAELAVLRPSVDDDQKAADHASDPTRVVGQLSFPVAQSVLRKAPRICRLGVGSMGLALFDGALPLATWLYMFMSDVTGTLTATGGELCFSYQYTKKRGKLLRFQTIHAAELSKHIERAQYALESVEEEGEAQRTMIVDGVRAPFDVPAFGPQTARLSGRRAIGGGMGHDSSFDAADVKDKVFVIRRRNKTDFSYVETIEKAQEAGAEAVVLVNYNDHVAKLEDKWAEGAITIPVLTMPLTIGSGMLARHGTVDLSFSFGDNATNGLAATGSEASANVKEGVPPERMALAAAARASWDGEQLAAANGETGSTSELEPEAEPTTESENQQGMIWVGGLPQPLATEEALRTLFERFGPVTSVTVRVKEGAFKSWALVSFAETMSADAALAADLTEDAPVATPLTVERADVDAQLRRSDTGALSRIWLAQQEKQEQWLLSLLSDLETDPQYIEAQGLVAREMGLPMAELEEELVNQELSFLRNSGHNLSQDTELSATLMDV